MIFAFSRKKNRKQPEPQEKPVPQSESAEKLTSTMLKGTAVLPIVMHFDEEELNQIAAIVIERINLPKQTKPLNVEPEKPRIEYCSAPSEAPPPPPQPSQASHPKQEPTQTPLIKLEGT